MASPLNHGGSTVHCADLPWFPIAPNVWVKLVKEFPSSGGYSVMIRASPGGVLPRHRHLADAEIYVLRGTGFHPQAGHYTAGDYVSEYDGATHDALHFDVETELLMIARGPSVFLDEEGRDTFRMDLEMLRGLRAAHA
jgi:quercetin dioxygenase-like cupin family protein